MKRNNGKLTATHLKSRGRIAIAAVVTVLGLGGSPTASAVPTFSDENWTTLGAQLDGPVYSLAPLGDALFIGGDFSTSAGQPAENIAHYTGTQWVVGAGLNGPVHTLISQGSVLHAGGEFTTAGGIPTEGIAKWTGSEWTELGGGLAGALPVQINAMALYNGTLYAAGKFDTADGNPANNIAQWNGEVWSPLGDGLNGAVHALLVSGDDLYAGGAFTEAGGIEAEHVARWDGNTWSPLGAGVNDTVHAFVMSGGNLYVGGAFTEAGGAGADHIARWDGNAWSPLDLGMNGAVYALAMFDGNLYAGGMFTEAGGLGASRVAEWNGTEWSAVGSGLNGPAHALAASDSALYIGGDFSEAGGEPAANLAVVRPVDAVNGAPVVDQGIDDQDGVYGTVFSYAIPENAFSDPDGDPLSYGASGLPQGIVLDGATFTGTPAEVGAFVVTVEASDPEGATVQTTFELVIAPAALTVTANNASRVYGEGNPEFTGTITENSDTITASFSTTADAESPVGEYAIVPTLNDPDDKLGNYSVTVENGVLTITPAALTVTANNASRVYGEENPEFTGTITENSDNITASFSTTADAESPVGEYDIVPTLNDPDDKLGNYSVTVENGVLTISEADLVLTVTTDDASRIYGEENPEFTGTISANSDNITASFSTTAEVESPVGEYDIVPTLNDPDDKLGNYSVTVENGVLTITPAPLDIVVDDASRRYAAANPSFTGEMTGIRNGDDITVSYGTEATQSSKAGTYAIKPELMDPDGRLENYSVNMVDGTLTITRIPLVLTVNDASRAYGEENPKFTGTLNTLRNDDNITAVYSTEATEASPVGTYVITWTLKDPDNRLVSYDLDTVQGTLTVTPTPLVVRADDTSRTYGDANPDFTGVISGMKNGDAFTASYSTDADEASPVGSYDIVPGIVDGPLENYTVNEIKGILSVTPAPLFVTADDKSKVFGEANPGLTARVTGFVLNEDTSVLEGELVLVTTAEEDSVVGDYPISPSGLNAANYAVHFIEGTLTILSADSADFEDWQKAHFSEGDLGEEGISGPNATPAGDGVANLLKYAFNMNPFVADVSTLTPGGEETSGLPLVTLVKNDASELGLVIEFLRRRNSGLVYTPQISTNLRDWEPVTAEATVIEVNDDWERVTVEVPVDSAAKQVFGAVSVSPGAL